jgi:hypothetical protein
VETAVKAGAVDPFTTGDALWRVWVHDGTVLSALFPILGQLRSYRLPQARGDALAGLTAAATLIPQALAYGQQAGLPPGCTPWWVLAGTMPKADRQVGQHRVPRFSRPKAEGNTHANCR